MFILQDVLSLSCYCSPLWTNFVLVTKICIKNDMSQHRFYINVLSIITFTFTEMLAVIINGPYAALICSITAGTTREHTAWRDSELPGIHHLQSCIISEPEENGPWIASCIANELQILAFIDSYLITFVEYTWSRITSYKSHKHTHTQAHCSQLPVQRASTSWERKSSVLPITYHTQLVLYAAVIQRWSHPTSVTFRVQTPPPQATLDAFNRPIIKKPSLCRPPTEISTDRQNVTLLSVLKVIFITRSVNFW